MAEDEVKFIRMADNLYQSGQIEDAKAALVNGLKLYPDNNAMQNLLQQCQDIKDLIIPDDIQGESKETKQHQPQNETELGQLRSYDKIALDVDEIKHKQHLSTNISFQMRLKVLIMELKTIKAYSLKEVIENENNTREKIHALEMCVGIVNTALGLNNFDIAEIELLKAESLSTEMLTKMKTVIIKKHPKKDEIKIPEDDIQIPDYRSTVTVRGDEKDVTNCILKAKTALDNNNYDRAEKLLLKAERIFPTKNARDLLKQVQAAKELKQNELIKKATETEEQVNTVTVEDSKLEDDIIDAVKCLRAFEIAFNTNKFEKAERMLNKAKRLDPSLEVEEKLSQVNAAKINKIMEERRKEEIEKAKRECKTAGECLYKSMKAYGAGDFVNAESLLHRAKTFDPMLKLEPEISTIKTKIVSESGKENKDKDKTGYDESLTEHDIKCAAECLYNAKKAYDAGDIVTAEQNLNVANSFDPSLNLELYLSNLSCIKKEKQKEIDMQIEREKKEVVGKGKSKIRKNDQPEIIKTFEHQEDSLESKKKITDKQITNGAEGQKSRKDNTKEKSNTKPPPKKEQVIKNLIPLAEKAIHDNKFEDAIKFLNTAEELYSTERAKELLKNISEMLISREENYLYFNYYEFPVEVNESHEAEALKCIKKAQAAFQNRQYDRAEHFLTKSIRICDTPMAKSFLETVLTTKARHSTNVTAEAGNVNDTMNEYNKCIDLSTTAIGDGNIATAECFLSKAILINPNDDDRKQLKHIQDVRSLQPSNDEAISSKPLKTDYDLKRERAAEMYVNWAVDAITKGMFHVAYRYLNWALEEHPNEQAKELLRYVQTNCLNERHPRTKNDIILQANRLLDKAEYFIYMGDFEQAESLLIIAWAMNTSQRTTLVHKKFLKKRLALFIKENKRDGGCDKKSENIFESDKLVELALQKHENNKFEEAEELLTRASEFYPSVRINKLLVEIGKMKNKESNPFKKAYKYVTKKMS